ncbi:LacI family DNA-binding transcriptional regulator [Paraburkholderia sp. RL17-337-BIB-A]|uniref:LacI family DNA-binding transcriptional regulator n=1 Tax=Paraburkholderia sp. RL17-337-BIB-A TaxID=3031636 RepID=UPI0038B8E720
MNDEKPQKTEAITLAYIAEAAGVSTATVARVIKGRGAVAPQTRARIADILRSTGYSPNAVARSLRMQRSFTLGHLLTRLTLSPLFAQIAHDLEEEALKYDYKVFLINLHAQSSREQASVRTLISNRVDAMIFTHAVDAENVRLAINAKIPVVQVERLVDARTSAVLVDHMAGSLEALRHLTELGHRRIAFIGVKPDPTSFFGSRAMSIEAERFSAYQEVLTEVGVEYDSALVRLEGNYPYAESGQAAAVKRVAEHASPANRAAGYESMRQLLSETPRPSAVFVAAGVFATGALQAIYDARLRVPDDISVLGYDDSLAPFLCPPLTSVALPFREIGQAACQLALAAIEHPDEIKTVLLKTELHVRASTGPAPRL